MQVYSLDVPFEQHKQFRAEPMEKPRRIQAPGLLENVASVSQQGRASTTPHPPLWLREGLTDMKFLGFEGRGPAKNLPPGGDYAEQKAKTGCERESDVRVLLACLMRFLIGISCHVCRAAKLLPGLARHVIRKFAYAFGCLFYGVSCMACICTGGLFKSVRGSGHLVAFRSEQDLLSQPCMGLKCSSYTQFAPHLGTPHPVAG